MPASCHISISIKPVPVTSDILPCICRITTCEIAIPPAVTIFYPGTFRHHIAFCILCSRCNNLCIIFVSKIYVHIPTDSIDSSSTAALPYSTWYRCRISASIPCNPHFHVCNLADIYMILVPVFIAIQHRCISRRANLIAISLCYLPQLRLAKRCLRGIFQINYHRIGHQIAFHIRDNILRICNSFLFTLRCTIKIHACRNPCRIRILHIALIICIQFMCSMPQSDKRELNSIVFYRLPVNITLPL